MFSKLFGGKDKDSSNDTNNSNLLDVISSSCGAQPSNLMTVDPRGCNIIHAVGSDLQIFFPGGDIYLRNTFHGDIRSLCSTLVMSGDDLIGMCVTICKTIESNFFLQFWRINGYKSALESSIPLCQSGQLFVSQASIADVILKKSRKGIVYFGSTSGSLFIIDPLRRQLAPTSLDFFINVYPILLSFQSSISNSSPSQRFSTSLPSPTPLTPQTSLPIQLPVAVNAVVENPKNPYLLLVVFACGVAIKWNSSSCKIISVHYGQVHHDFSTANTSANPILKQSTTYNKISSPFYLFNKLQELHQAHLQVSQQQQQQNNNNSGFQIESLNTFLASEIPFSNDNNSVQTHSNTLSKHPSMISTTFSPDHNIEWTSSSIASQLRTPYFFHSAAWHASGDVFGIAAIPVNEANNPLLIQSYSQCHYLQIQQRQQLLNVDSDISYAQLIGTINAARVYDPIHDFNKQGIGRYPQILIFDSDKNGCELSSISISKSILPSFPLKPHSLRWMSDSNALSHSMDSNKNINSILNPSESIADSSPGKIGSANAYSSTLFSTPAPHDSNAQVISTGSGAFCLSVSYFPQGPPPCPYNDALDLKAVLRRESDSVASNQASKIDENSFSKRLQRVVGGQGIPADMDSKNLALGCQVFDVLGVSGWKWSDHERISELPLSNVDIHLIQHLNAIQKSYQPNSLNASINDKINSVIVESESQANIKSILKATKVQTVELFNHFMSSDADVSCESAQSSLSSLGAFQVLFVSSSHSRRIAIYGTAADRQLSYQGHYNLRRAFKASLPNRITTYPKSDILGESDMTLVSNIQNCKDNNNKNITSHLNMEPLQYYFKCDPTHNSPDDYSNPNSVSYGVTSGATAFKGSLAASMVGRPLVKLIAWRPVTKILQSIEASRGNTHKNQNQQDENELNNCNGVNEVEKEVHLMRSSLMKAFSDNEFDEVRVEETKKIVDKAINVGWIELPLEAQSKNDNRIEGKRKSTILANNVLKHLEALGIIDDDDDNDNVSGQCNSDLNKSLQNTDFNKISSPDKVGNLILNNSDDSSVSLRSTGASHLSLSQRDQFQLLLALEIQNRLMETSVSSSCYKTEIKNDLTQSPSSPLVTEDHVLSLSLSPFVPISWGTSCLGRDISATSCIVSSLNDQVAPSGLIQQVCSAAALLNAAVLLTRRSNSRGLSTIWRLDHAHDSSDHGTKDNRNVEISILDRITSSPIAPFRPSSDNITCRVSLFKTVPSAFSPPMDSSASLPCGSLLVATGHADGIIRLWGVSGNRWRRLSTISLHGMLPRRKRVMASNPTLPHAPNTSNSSNTGGTFQWDSNCFRGLQPARMASNETSFAIDIFFGSECMPAVAPHVAVTTVSLTVQSYSVNDSVVRIMLVAGFADGTISAATISTSALSEDSLTSTHWMASTATQMPSTVTWIQSTLMKGFDGVNSEFCVTAVDQQANCLSCCRGSSVLRAGSEVEGSAVRAALRAAVHTQCFHGRAEMFVLNNNSNGISNNALNLSGNRNSNRQQVQSTTANLPNDQFVNHAGEICKILSCARQPWNSIPPPKNEILDGTAVVSRFVDLITSVVDANTTATSANQPVDSDIPLLSALDARPKIVCLPSFRNSNGNLVLRFAAGDAKGFRIQVATFARDPNTLASLLSIDHAASDSHTTVSNQVHNSLSSYISHFITWGGISSQDMSFSSMSKAESRLLSLWLSSSNTLTFALGAATSKADKKPPIICELSVSSELEAIKIPTAVTLKTFCPPPLAVPRPALLSGSASKNAVRLRSKAENASIFTGYISTIPNAARRSLSLMGGHNGSSVLFLYPLLNGMYIAGMAPLISENSKQLLMRNNNNSKGTWCVTNSLQNRSAFRTKFVQELQLPCNTPTNLVSPKNSPSFGVINPALLLQFSSFQSQHDNSTKDDDPRLGTKTDSDYTIVELNHQSRSDEPIKKKGFFKSIITSFKEKNEQRKQKRSNKHLELDSLNRIGQSTIIKSDNSDATEPISQRSSVGVVLSGKNKKDFARHIDFALHEVMEGNNSVAVVKNSHETKKNLRTTEANQQNCDNLLLSSSFTDVVLNRRTSLSPNIQSIFFKNSIKNGNAASSDASNHVSSNSKEFIKLLNSSLFFIPQTSTNSNGSFNLNDIIIWHEDEASESEDEDFALLSDESMSDDDGVLRNDDDDATDLANMQSTVVNSGHFTASSSSNLKETGFKSEANARVVRVHAPDVAASTQTASCESSVGNQIIDKAATSTTNEKKQGLFSSLFKSSKPKEQEKSTSKQNVDVTKKQAEENLILLKENQQKLESVQQTSYQLKDSADDFANMARMMRQKYGK